METKIMANIKLQNYFDYYKEKHPYNKGWLGSLTEWITYVQEIKKAVLTTDFSDLDETQITINLEEILKDKSEGKITSIAVFFEKLLFEQHNSLGNIGQGVIWGTPDNPHKTIIKGKIEFTFLIKLLREESIEEADKIISELIKVDRDYQAAKFRVLRALFPSQLTSADAPNKLDERIKVLKDKLGVQINADNHLEKHQQLMQLIDCDNIFFKQIFFWEISDMLNSKLNLKKAIIYYGAPGTGKTYKAKQQAEQFIGEHRLKIGKEKDKYKIETVQFHPSYSYEDFIEGIRPSSDKDLSLFSGTFKTFCKESGKAEMALYQDVDFLNDFKEKNYDFSLIKVSDLKPSQKKLLNIDTNLLADGITISEVIEPAFFIIDEINRAELSRVFGELMYSLEYRGYNGKIKTQYSYLNKEKDAPSVYFWENDADWFFIPQNVFLIGTMNNIDRSVDSFDFALRRRFSWEEVEPNFDIIRNLLKATWKDALSCYVPAHSLIH